MYRIILVPFLVSCPANSPCPAIHDGPTRTRIFTRGCLLVCVDVLRVLWLLDSAGHNTRHATPRVTLRSPGRSHVAYRHYTSSSSKTLSSSSSKTLSSSSSSVSSTGASKVKTSSSSSSCPSSRLSSDVSRGSMSSPSSPSSSSSSTSSKGTGRLPPARLPPHPPHPPPRPQGVLEGSRLLSPHPCRREQPHGQRAPGPLASYDPSQNPAGKRRIGPPTSAHSRHGVQCQIAPGSHAPPPQNALGHRGRCAASCRPSTYSPFHYGWGYAPWRYSSLIMAGCSGVVGHRSTSRLFTVAIRSCS